KTGIGITEILEAVVKHVPAPRGNPDGILRALMIDSWYDSYRGAVCLVRVVDGRMKKGQKIRLMSTKADYEITEMGVFSPFEMQLDELGPGEVGFFSASSKSVHDTKVGDTITDTRNPTTEALEGFEEVKPMVFAGIFPTDSDQYGDLRD